MKNDAKLNSPKSQRAFFRISLRLLLVIIAIICVWLGMKVKRVADQRQAISIMSSLEGSFSFDYQYDSKNSRLDHDAWPGPKWMRRWLGEEWFREIYVAVLYNLNNEQLTTLTGLMPELASLELFSQAINDNGLAGIGRCQNLVRLHIEHASFGDEGLRHIGQCQSLQMLSIRGTQVTDQGLRHLSELRELQRLDLSDCDRLTSECAIVIANHLPDLESLRLPAACDGAATELRLLEKLRSLSIGGTKVPLPEQLR